MRDDSKLRRRPAKPRQRGKSPDYPRLVGLGVLAVAAACGGSVVSETEGDGGSTTVEIPSPIPHGGGGTTTTTTTEGWGGGLDGGEPMPWGGGGTGGYGGSGGQISGGGGAGGEGFGGGLDGDIDVPWGGSGGTP